jgi:quercetin dioxygenase-like cupin family protein
MWTEHKRTLVDSGDIIFLPAQQEHSLQCTDKAGLALVGHFYPSGEPNINY